MSSSEPHASRDKKASKSREGHRDPRDRDPSRGDQREARPAPRPSREPSGSSRPQPPREEEPRRGEGGHRERGDRAEGSRRSGGEHAEAPRDGKEPNRDRREPGQREHRSEARDGKEAKSERKPEAARRPEDQEAWLDSLIADCNDPRPPRDGAAGSSEKPSRDREKMPKRPSSRADSRPKGDFDAAAVKEARRPENPSERPARPDRPPAAASTAVVAAPVPAAGAASAAPVPATTAVPVPTKPGAAAPPVPRPPPQPRAPRREVPVADEVEDEIEVEEHIKSPTAPANHVSRGGAAAGNIEEDIEVNIPVAKPRGAENKKAEDDIDEEIDYDDDFEAAEEEEERAYQPKIKAVAAAPPEPEKASNKLVTIRPQPNQSKQAPAPPVADKEPALADIKKAMESENERLASVKRSGAAASASAESASKKKGFLADYESTMPKFNLTSGSSASERAAVQRLRDLRQLKLLEKRSVEKVDLFQQRPQKDISLFLAGKSLKYCNLQTVSAQTGDDDMEVGTITDEVWNDDKEMQFPNLTTGRSSASGGEPSQLLSFLRRVLPLFEASMAEVRQAQGAAGFVPQQARAAGEQQVRSQARCGVADSFISQYIGARISVEDITICPQWYGADHALVLYTWPEVQRPTPRVGGSLDHFMRPLRSIVGLYPLLSPTSAADGGSLLRPVRCLASCCRLASLAVVSGRSHLIVAGSEMGSLLVWDLRQKPRCPGANPEGSLPSASDPEVAHFEGPIWLVTTFSTDLFAFSSVGSMSRDPGEDDAPPLGGRRGGGESLGGGVHSVEICCVRCSDVMGGDSLIFALDLMGIVSFWRVLELANLSHQSVKLALQGSLCLAEGAHVLGDFLGASLLCVHPQQQAQFVVVSTSGLRQTGRKRSSSVADGPVKLELTHCSDEEPTAFLNQPCGAAFSPFFPGLLLAAYEEGDLALFDCSLCVPITHWASAISKAPSRATTVAWSPRRPCVFFVKCGSALEVWDLSERMHAPVLVVDLDNYLGSQTHAGSSNGHAAPELPRAACAELFVDLCGRPVVGHDGFAVVLGLPLTLTAPLQTAPLQHNQPEKSVDELLVAGSEKVQAFPTLSRHCRTVEVPQQCALERDLLRRLLAGMQPLQAAV